MEPVEITPKPVEIGDLGEFKTNRKLVDFIIPTFNNVPMLQIAVRSLCFNTAHEWENPYFHIWIVNNGEHGIIENKLKPTKHWTLLDEDKNMGWEDALRDAYPFTDAPIVCFLNDDIIVPPVNPHWLTDALRLFWERPEVGAVGPTSNFVMGYQSVQNFVTGRIGYTSLLSGFCMFVRRKALEAVGGIPRDMEGGGDDIDLSIRMNMGGWKMAITKDAYLHHHGAATGSRLYADWYGSDKGIVMKRQLAQRYGFKNLITCMSNSYEEADRA